MTVSVYRVTGPPSSFRLAVAPNALITVDLMTRREVPRNEVFWIALDADQPVFPQIVRSGHRPWDPVPETLEMVMPQLGPADATFTEWVYPDGFQGGANGWIETETISLLNPTPETGLATLTFLFRNGRRPRTHDVVLPATRVVNVDLSQLFAGYNRWAETNRIVVLYPQARATWGMPLNPYGCWDWWGYTGTAYTGKSAPQIAALRAMVEKLAGLPRSDRPRAAIPAAPGVVDASASALAVAWASVPEASDYELEGAGVLVRTKAPGASLAVDGLAPASQYSLDWRARDARGRVLAQARLQGTTGAQPGKCDPWFASNVAHVAAGRAYVLWGLTYALGTNQPMGWLSLIHI